MRIIFAAFYFVVLLSFSSCIMVGKSIVKQKNNLETIPQDFNPKKHVLLVAEMPKPANPDKRHNGVTKKLDKELKKVYPYQYEIVTMKDILNPEGKYKDTAKYKYALVNNQLPQVQIYIRLIFAFMIDVRTKLIHLAAIVQVI